MTSLRERVGYLTSGGSVRKSVLTLLTGSTVSLLIAYAAQIILTRLFSPADFGVLDAFVAIVTIAAPAAMLRYEDAVMLPEKEDDAAAVVNLCFTLLIGACIILSMGLPLRERIASWLGAPALAPWILMVPVAILFMRLGTLAELWLTRQRRFKQISAGQIVRGGTMSVVRVLSGTLKVYANAAGLIIGFLAGHLATTLLFVTAVLRSDAGLFQRLWSRDRMRQIAIRFIRFPRYTLPASLLAALIGRAPFLILLYFFSAEAVGFFGRAFAAYAIPLGLLGAAIAQVFFVEAADAAREGTLRVLTARFHDRLVMLGLFPTIAVIVGGPELFSFVFGLRWETAGTYGQIVVPWLFLASVSSPLTRLYDVLERQRTDFLLGLVMFIVQTAALVVGGLSGNVYSALIAVAVAGLLMRAVMTTVLLRMAGLAGREMRAPYLRYALCAIPGALVVYGATLADGNWPVFVALLVGSLLYLGAIVLVEGRKA